MELYLEQLPIKISGDTLIISGANTYTGATNINAGVVQLENQDGLGSSSLGVTGASNTTVANLAALKINGTGYNIPEPLFINGTGINTTGAIRNTTGSNNLSSLLTVSTAARINVDAGTLTLTNNTESLKLSNACKYHFNFKWKQLKLFRKYFYRNCYYNRRWYFKN
ncbi:hypothetical protein EB001_14960 [bacterium]|nr:hypothetical protein [bacterium]